MSKLLENFITELRTQFNKEKSEDKADDAMNLSFILEKLLEDIGAVRLYLDKRLTYYIEINSAKFERRFGGDDND